MPQRMAQCVLQRAFISKIWSSLDITEYTISVVDKEALQPQLIPAMIAISDASDKAIHAHIADNSPNSPAMAT
ncbi:hypothetical protein EI94DRAFT_752419 [Lactarius quietus]|nr:hypothetical protein EI94DRAFT_752419 [Lactarius quietus]